MYQNRCIMHGFLDPMHRIMHNEKGSDPLGLLPQQTVGINIIFHTHSWLDQVILCASETLYQLATAKNEQYLLQWFAGARTDFPGKK